MDSGIIKDYLLKAMETLDREIFIITPDLEIRSANRTAAKAWGKQVTGKPCYQVLYHRQSPCRNCPISDTQKTAEPFLAQDRSQCLPLYAEDSDSLEALVRFDIDLTHLSDLQEDLQRSNSFLRNMLLSAVDSVIAADLTGKIIIFNDAAAEVSGYSVEEALNHLNIRELYPDDGARQVMKKLRSEEQDGKGKLKAYQVNVKGKDGDLIPISLYASIICEGEKEVATIGFFHDLRERLRIQRELEKTQIQLLQAEKMASLGKLAAGVAHQLNNPLGGITLYAKLVLEEYDLAEEAREDMERILKDAERCRDTVRELLEFARQTRYFMQPHDVTEAMNRTLFLLESHPLFQNIEIEKDVPESLPLMTADIQQLNHLLMNIILNAAEAMDGKGRLTIKAHATPEQDGISISIADTGPGIPEDDLPRIFEPFFTTKEEGKGTGLGLSLGYRIVETHGGTINVSSRVGEGTTFHIEFPLTTGNNGENSNE